MINLMGSGSGPSSLLPVGGVSAGGGGSLTSDSGPLAAGGAISLTGATLGWFALRRKRADASVDD